MSARPLVKSMPLRHQWCAGGSLSGWLPVANGPVVALQFLARRFVGLAGVVGCG